MLVSDHLNLIDADDGKLFRVRVPNTGEERIAHYRRFTLAGRALKFPCFADLDCAGASRRDSLDGWKELLGLSAWLIEGGDRTAGISLVQACRSP